MLIDLTHPMTENMPVFPGKEQPSFGNCATISRDRYREKHLSMDSHVGTHTDAPAHMLVTGKTLDMFHVSKFSGKAVIIEIPQDVRIITREILSEYRNLIESAGFVLFNTGWSKLWGSPGYMDDYPVPNTGAATWLTSFSLKGIGIDTVSVDPVDSNDWPVHHILFSREFIIVENLRFPDHTMPSQGDFFCFPLKITGADGSPVRAVIDV